MFLDFFTKTYTVLSANILKVLLEPYGEKQVSEEHRCSNLNF